FRQENLNKQIFVFVGIEPRTLCNDAFSSVRPYSTTLGSSYRFRVVIIHWELNQIFTNQLNYMKNLLILGQFEIEKDIHKSIELYEKAVNLGNSDTMNDQFE